MVFFKDHDVDNYDRVDACFKTIRKMWNAYRQRNKLHTLNYSYQDNEHRLHPEGKGRHDREGTSGEDEQAAREEPEHGDEPDQRHGSGSQDDDDGGSITDVIDKALNDPDGIMDKFGS